MGGLYKYLLRPYLQPYYDWIDSNIVIRQFAETYIYSKPKYADFFLMTVLTILNTIIGFGTVLYVQLHTGLVPSWLIFLYYCSWVGLGGSMMGSAYGLAHKEGHNQVMYRKWIRESSGNVLENWLGVLYGNIPYNFSASHVLIHHRLDGGIGDTFYLWDMDRTNINSFVLYVYRILLHMIGYSSWKYFKSHNMDNKADKIATGTLYFVTIGATFLVITRSFSFLFWIYIQPFFCMTFFLALINVGFHGFLEFDKTGTNIQMVNSTTIIDGEDDLFGEDDHMAHHYNANVYYRDLPEHQQSKLTEYSKYKATVFRKFSIVELSILILLGVWDRLADHYVDYSNSLSKDEIIKMLKERARTVETTYDKYEEYLSNPTEEAKKLLTVQSS
eukprot:gene6117-8432_t